MGVRPRKQHGLCMFLFLSVFTCCTIKEGFPLGGLGWTVCECLKELA